MTTPTTPPTFICGTVNADGSTVSNWGTFDVIKGSVGLWTIIFLPAFDTPPAVTAIQVFGGLDNTTGSDGDNSVVTYVDATRFQLLTGTNGGQRDWRGFSFIAAGSAGS